MTNKKHAGTFHSVDNVLYKITQLEAEGYTKDEIYVVTNVKDDKEVLQGDTEVNLVNNETRSIADHARTLFAGKNKMLSVLQNMGFTDEQSARYYEDLKIGGIAVFTEDKQSPE